MKIAEQPAYPKFTKSSMQPRTSMLRFWNSQPPNVSIRVLHLKFVIQHQKKCRMCLTCATTSVSHCGNPAVDKIQGYDLFALKRSHWRSPSPGADTTEVQRTRDCEATITEGAISPEVDWQPHRQRKRRASENENGLRLV